MCEVCCEICHIFYNTAIGGHCWDSLLSLLNFFISSSNFLSLIQLQSFSSSSLHQTSFSLHHSHLLFSLLIPFFSLISYSPHFFKHFISLSDLFLLLCHQQMFSPLFTLSFLVCHFCLLSLLERNNSLSIFFQLI